MSDSEHSTMSYTFISSDFDPSSWGIPLMDVGELPDMDPYEEVAQQGQAAPPSPAYVPDPIKLEHHVPVYVLEPVYPEYLVPSDDDIPIEDSKEDPEEEPKEDPEDVPVDYVAVADDDEEEVEHLALTDSTVVASPVVDFVPFAEETESFKIDESAATPPPLPAYHTTSRMSVRTQKPIPFHSKVEVARLLTLTTPPPSPLTLLSSPLPQRPPPPTSPTYAQTPLGYRAAMMRAASPPTHHPLPLPAPSASRRADIPEANIPHQKRLLFTAPTPRFEVGENFDVAARQPGSTMALVVKLRVSYEADVHRRESKEFYTQHQDAQRDHAALHDEVDTLRRYLSSFCTTHEQERDTDDHATKDIMRIQALEARARVDTLEDTSSKHVTPYVVDMIIEMGKHNSLDDIIILGSFPPLSMSGTITVGNAPGKSLYANITGKPSEKKVNVRTLYTPKGNGIDVVVPVDSIHAISECFANTTYGFFLGRSSSTRLFSFQFNFMDGLDNMLENGPWFIQNNPLILKKWHPDENLLKEDVSTIPVWVKLYGVPVMAFSEDGLSAIATKLGTPLMLDSYTTDWGR
ncbi:putative reverse transcriptase domain-containing protein [Tanacetum coccineum]